MNKMESENISEFRRRISVEISPTCNLRCPECNVGERLHIKSSKRRNDLELTGKIIEYIPLDSLLLFVGLGEPTIPYSQRRILNILNERPDLKGFIQTNGTYPLMKDITELIENERLEIGLSLDQQHFAGGQKNLKIQPKYVESIATIITDKETSHTLPKDFPNLDRILISPLFVRKKIANSWRHLNETCVEYQEMAKNGITIYTEIPPLVREDNIGFFEEAEKDLTSISPDGWRKSRKHGFYVDMETCENEEDMRVLIDGTYVNDSSLGIEPWKEIDKHSLLIESLPKVFDSKTGKYIN
jgi:organic radical activating enzyme